MISTLAIKWAVCYHLLLLTREGLMASTTLRMSDELMGKLRKTAGKRGVNAFVVGLVEAAVDGKEWVVPSTVAIKPERAGVLRPASDLPAPASLEGYTCSEMVKGKQCPNAAVYWRGPMARCAEH